MSSRPPSRNPFSLSDVLRAVEIAADLAPRRRQDLASAVPRTATLLDRPLEQVPAHPRLLVARLGEIAPAAHGLSRGRWNNLRSLLGKALALVQPMAPGRHLSLLSPAWKVLFATIPDRGQRARLSRPAHHCSAEGVDPDAVDDAVMARYGAGLNNSLLRAPATQLRDTRGAWNRLCREMSDGPARPVSVEPSRTSYVLPWGAFSPSLEQDARAWLDRLAGRDLLDETPFRPVRLSTIIMREWQLRAFASALVQRSVPAAEITRLADLVGIERFKSGLYFFLGRRDNTTSSAIAGFATMLTSVARHWVQVPPDHLDRMRAVGRKLQLPRRRMTEANRRRLLQFDNRDNVLALLRLPAELMVNAERLADRWPHRAALQAQRALAVSILTFAPMRIGNLAALDRERHLMRQGQGETTTVHLIMEEWEVKNRRALEYELPKPTIALLQRYLDVFWPILAPSGTTALFPGRAGRPKGRQGFGRQISRTIFARSGLRMTPHFFRHTVSKLFLTAQPGELEVMRQVLGHDTIETTRGYYAGLETAAAVRRFDRTILRLAQEPKA
jgi:integrase